MHLEQSSHQKPMYHYYSVLFMNLCVSDFFSTLMLFAGHLEFGLHIFSLAVANVTWPGLE